MSKDEIHGGGEWGFSKCVWSPSYKQGDRKSPWLFWTNILRIQQGDIVIHLRGKGHSAAFVGYSIAATTGHETIERPPQAGDWNYATSFFRAILKEYRSFQEPIRLDDFFLSHKDELTAYLRQLSTAPTNRFFVYQSNRLQCLNGAYLSICDEKMLSLILNKTYNVTTPATETASTAEVWREVRQRVGQSQFSEAVKKNYNYTCCFPHCKINDPRFLVGSHIARWVDNPEKRGNTSNGLCLCSFHDRAFENGYFSLDNQYRILLSKDSKIQSSTAFIEYIVPYSNEKIDKAEISPDTEALQDHRFRCKIKER